MAGWATYEYARKCTGGPKPGALALMAWIVKNYPKSKNWGIYRCSLIPGSSSMSVHGEGRALDVGYDPVKGKGNPDGYRLFAHIHQHAVELGVQGIIWDRHISTNRGDNRVYSGGTDETSAHVNHLHIELTNEAARSLTAATIGKIMGTPPAGGDFAGGANYGGADFAQGADTTSLLSGLTTLTSGATWIRVAMFIGGVIAILLGLGILATGEIGRLTAGNATRNVKAGYKAVIK
jgi:hypothetical protein